MELMFPDKLLEIFEVVNYERTATGYIFNLDEKLSPPQGYSFSELESKGIYDAVSVTDFSLRRKATAYRIRRRKRLIKNEGKAISKKYKLVATGTRKTEEFAALLKGLNIYYSD